MYTIYKMTIGLESYVGVTSDYQHRRYTHKSKLLNNRHTKSIQNAYKKINGMDEVAFTILKDNVPFDVNRREEHYYINVLQPSLNKEGRFIDSSIKPRAGRVRNDIENHPKYKAITKLLDKGMIDKQIKKALSTSSLSVTMVRNHYYLKQDFCKLLIATYSDAVNNTTFEEPKTTT